MGTQKDEGGEMNILTKQRYISTSIWSDDWFDSLTEREKLVYFYLLTNEHTNAAGVYQCTLKNVRLEIGLERDEIERIMAKFADAGKAFYYKDYIIITKWLKHQKIGERSKLFLGASKLLKTLPDDVKAFISDRRHYDYDVSKIIGKPPYAIDSLCQNNDSLSKNEDNLSPDSDSLSIAYGKNDEKTAHDSDLDRDIDIDRDSDKDSAEPLLSESQKSAIELSELLLTSHRKEFPDYLSGNSDNQIKKKINGWAADIEKLIRIDKKDPEIIRQVILWVKTPGRFWFHNIESGAKLRKQFERLYGEMKTSGNKRSSTSTSSHRIAADNVSPEKLDEYFH